MSGLISKTRLGKNSHQFVLLFVLGSCREADKEFRVQESFEAIWTIEGKHWNSTKPIEETKHLSFYAPPFSCPLPSFSVRHWKWSVVLLKWIESLNCWYSCWTFYAARKDRRLCLNPNCFRISLSSVWYTRCNKYKEGEGERKRGRGS